MIEEIIVFITGVVIISGIIYKQVQTIWYDNLMKRTIMGHDVSTFSRKNEFKDMMEDVSKTIIKQYEMSKKDKIEEEDKDEMYQ
jgi:hypothetical protein